MRPEILVFGAVVVFVAVVLAMLARNSGFLETVSDEGFVLRTLTRKRLSVRFVDLVSPAVRYSAFLPRVSVSAKGLGGGRLSRKYTIFLCDNDDEEQFIGVLSKGVGITEAIIERKNR